VLLLELYLDLYNDERAETPSLTGGWMFRRPDIAKHNDAIIGAIKTALSPRVDLVDKGYIVGHLFGVGYGVLVTQASLTAINSHFKNATDLLLYNLPVPPDATLAQEADTNQIRLAAR
jgi:hypothetical protein